MASNRSADPHGQGQRAGRSCRCNGWRNIAISLIHLFGSVLPTPRLPMLAENLEDQVEELHYRYPDCDIDRNLQPTTRLLSPAQQVGDVFRGLLQSIG